MRLWKTNIIKKPRNLSMPPVPAWSVKKKKKERWTTEAFFVNALLHPLRNPGQCKNKPFIDLQLVVYVIYSSRFRPITLTYVRNIQEKKEKLRRAWSLPNFRAILHDPCLWSSWSVLQAKARRLTLALEVFGVIWLFTSCLYCTNAVKRLTKHKAFVELYKLSER